ncbi:MAG: malate transporter [Rhodobacteraceae bacterium]|nr:malate transporter [Paracoccaceae bacterium]
MIGVLLQILPFFLLIGIGYLAAWTNFFNSEANEYLTKFVFYFSLSAMLFRFSSNLEISKLLDIQFGLAYLLGCLTVYSLFMGVALMLRKSWSKAAIEGQCAVIGNNGFMAFPILISLMGDVAAAPVLFVLVIDLIVFGSLVVIFITADRQGAVSTKALNQVGIGLLKNPMVMAMTLGLLWSASGITLPYSVDEFLRILGSAATPCALFVIGASLSTQSLGRLNTTIWLSFGKLIVHPISVAVFALWVFDVDPFAASVMIATAAMPTAGNIYIVAQHYGVAPTQVSSTILISTLTSIVTLSIVLGWVLGT